MNSSMMSQSHWSGRERGGGESESGGQLVNVDGLFIQSGRDILSK